MPNPFITVLALIVAGVTATFGMKAGVAFIPIINRLTMSFSVSSFVKPTVSVPAPRQVTAVISMFPLPLTSTVVDAPGVRGTRA